MFEYLFLQSATYKTAVVYPDNNHVDTLLPIAISIHSQIQNLKNAG